MELLRKIVSGIILTLLLTSVLTLAFNIQPLKVYAANSLIYPENQCLSFDGADDYVSVISSVYQTQELTIELWIAPEYTIENGSNSAYGRTYGAVLSYTETWASQGGWVLCFNFSDGHLFFRYRYKYWVDAFIEPFYETNTVYTNRAFWNSSSWYHIAVTYSPTTHSLVFYVNETVDRAYTWTTEPGATERSLAYESASLKIGGDLTYGYMFRGLIDEVRLWNVSRTHSEIGSSWDRVLNITECAKPELVGYWRFDEGAGLETKDFSSQGNNAILGLAPFNPTWIDFGAPITPEFPSILILPLFMMVTAIATILFKKKRKAKAYLP